jgi:hypothetical protein
MLVPGHCVSCKFVQTKGKFDLKPICHKNPPQICQEPGDLFGVAVWPIVKPSDYCHEYRKK